MFSRLKSAWQRYLDSIPKPDDPAPISDAKIIRDHFRPEPHSEEVVRAYSELAELMTEHLPGNTRTQARKRILAKLKPGEEPIDSLARWFQSNVTPERPSLGLIALDWKAREEVEWQAIGVLKAHGIVAQWHYDWKTDTDWQAAVNAGRLPVDAPLDEFARFLKEHGYSLVRFSPYDGQLAFVVESSRLQSVLNAMTTLSIRAKVEA